MSFRAFEAGGSADLPEQPVAELHPSAGDSHALRALRMWPRALVALPLLALTRGRLASKWP